MHGVKIKYDYRFEKMLKRWLHIKYSFVAKFENDPKKKKNIWSWTLSWQSDAVRDRDKHLLHQHPFWRTFPHLIRIWQSSSARLSSCSYGDTSHSVALKSASPSIQEVFKHKLFFVTLSIKAFFIMSKLWYFCLVALSRSVQWGPANLPQGPGRHSAVFEAAH